MKYIKIRFQELCHTHKSFKVCSKWWKPLLGTSILAIQCVPCVSAVLTASTSFHRNVFILSNYVTCVQNECTVC